MGLILVVCVVLSLILVVCVVIDSCGTRGIVIDSCGTCGYEGVLATLGTDLQILVRELGEPSDNRTVEKLPKFSPEDKSCLEYCRHIL